MKIEFNSSGTDYIEIRNGTPGKVSITLSAQDASNHLNTIVNSGEITREQFLEIIAELGIPLANG